VGVGEATLPPTAIAMLGDRFPPPRLGFATSVYYAGVPVGFGVSLAVAGWVVPRLGWQACFVLLGAVGLGAVGFVWRMGPAAARQRGAAAGSGADGSLAVRLGRAFAAEPTLLVLVAGAALLVYQSASSQHLVTWLVQERGFAYSRAAYVGSAMVLGAGLAGSLGFGALTDAAERRLPGGRLLAFAGVGAVSLAATAAFYLLSPASPLFLAAWLAAQAWALGWFGPMLAAIHDLAPAHSRATVVGFALMAVNLTGVALGPWVTGAIGDRVDLTTGLLTSVAVGAVGLALVGLVAWRQRRAKRGQVLNLESSPATPTFKT
jgi:MFS family permease